MGISYNPTIVTDGLVLCADAGNTKSYPGSGTTWTDLSGNGNNGTLTNGPTFSADLGGRIIFNGSNQFVDLGAMSNLDASTKSMTVNMWAWASGNDSSWRAVISNRDSAMNEAAWWGIWKSVSNVWHFRVGTTVLNASGYSITTPSMLTLVRDRAAGTMRAYVNGNQVSSTTASLSAASGNVWVGKILTSGAEFFSGTVPIAMIYTSALTNAEVLQNFNALRGRFGL